MKGGGRDNPYSFDKYYKILGGCKKWKMIGIDNLQEAGGGKGSGNAGGSLWNIPQVYGGKHALGRVWESIPSSFTAGYCKGG